MSGNHNFYQEQVREIGKILIPFLGKFYDNTQKNGKDVKKAVLDDWLIFHMTMYDLILLTKGPMVVSF